MITFATVCSGIGAPEVALAPLGWRPLWQAEIEPFPSSVLAHHYPHVPNLGDMTKLPARVRAGEIETPDALIGGTPCQAFSVAGMRAGLIDPRGQLTLTYVDLLNAIDERRPGHECIGWWENVPGVLSDKANAFGCFLGLLAGEECELVPPGKSWPHAGVVHGPQRTIAWRVLDAQYFGLAQRRKRVFVVASARKGFDPVRVLFEPEGVRRDSAPSREAWQDVTGTLTARFGRNGGAANDDVKQGRLICASNSEGASGPPFLTCSNIGKTVNNQTPLRAMAFDTVETLDVPAILTFHAEAQPDQMRFDAHVTASLTCSQRAAVAPRGLAIRRLTPRECERLQGFPDDYTLISARGKPAADGPRYKALGNSMAVPVMRWIGARIKAQTC